MSVTVYTNSDGMIQKFGTSEAKSLQQGGWISNHGPYSTLTLNLDLTNLTQTESIQNDVLALPDKCLIESIELVTIVAAATGTAVDIGLINIDRDTTSEITASVSTSDPNGIIEAYPTAAMNLVGEHEHYWQTRSLGSNSGAGNATVGAIVGEILAEPCLITASQTDATDFTAGKIQLRINYIPNAVTGFGEVH